MQLDLRGQHELPLSVTKELNDTAWDLRADFNLAIDEASRSNCHDPAWMVSSPASRNTFQSPLFVRCVNLVLVQRMAERGELPARILTDSPSVAALLAQICEGADVEIIVSSRPSKLRRILSRCFIVLGILSDQLNIQRGVKKALPIFNSDDNSLILIDTFVMPGFEQKDRYYTGLLDLLNEEETKNIAFVPTFLGINKSNMARSFQLLRESRQPMLFKEHSLTWLDIAKSLWCAVKGSFSSTSKVTLRGLDISSLINEELRSLMGFPAMLAGLLNICFAKRLADSGVKIQHVVSWFENQAPDRGWHMGFNRYYPDARKVGYQGFPAIPLYLCLSPTEGEFYSGSVPQDVAIAGESHKGLTDEFATNLRLQVSPSFRYTFEKMEKREPIEGEFLIFVALSHHAKFSGNVVAQVKEAILSMEGVKVIYKAHPLNRKQDLLRIFGGCIPSDLISGNTNIEEVFAKCDMVVGGYSTTGLQAMAMGKPVVNMLWRFGVNLYYWPGGFTSPLLEECVGHRDLRRAIEKIRASLKDGTDSYQLLSEKVRSHFFSPVTKEGALQLLGLSGLSDHDGRV